MGPPCPDPIPAVFWTEHGSVLRLATFPLEPVAPFLVHLPGHFFGLPEDDP
jgi:hypothetical protein